MDKLAKILSEVAHLNLDGQIVDQTNIMKLGSSCDVYQAWSNKHMKSVAVKQIREFISEDVSFAKRLAREIKVWASLEHENVLPLLGYFTVEKNKMPRLVSEWMEDGTMNDYMKTFPKCSFETLRMVLEIASGLAYLHEHGVIHADLKTQNVLISKEKTPLLTDFGLSILSGHSRTSSTNSSTNDLRGTLRWMAREFFAVSSDPVSAAQKHDKKTDVWAFGMVIYELLTWKIPYADKANDLVAMFAIASGELPAPPSEVGEPQIFRELWNLCHLCWKDRSSRPMPTELIRRASSESSAATVKFILSGPTLRHLNLEGKIIRKELLQIRIGNMYDFFTAWSSKHNRKVTVKRINVPMRDDPERAKEVAKNISNLAKLTHKCILPFLGYFVEDEENMLHLVFEEMQLTLKDFMVRFPRGGIDTWNMLSGIASGLSYLHEKDIINPGLQSHNILISNLNTPLFAGFDIFYTLHAQTPMKDPANTLGDAVRWMKTPLLTGFDISTKLSALHVPTPMRVSPNDLGGEIRWMAVELLECTYCAKYTKETDVWAFGMVAYELISGETPFYECSRDDKVLLKIIGGGMPMLPRIHGNHSDDQHDYSYQLFRMCQACWRRNPSKRPSAAELRQYLSQDPAPPIVSDEEKLKWLQRLHQPICTVHSLYEPWGRMRDFY